MRSAVEPCSWDAQPWLCLYAEARQWQTGIGAFLGFLALMAAALWNFSLNRRRDRQLRREEMVSIAAAVYGEILLLRGELTSLARTINFSKKQGLTSAFGAEAFMYKPSQPLIYPALAYRLGLLPSDLVIGITRFYDRVESARRGLENFDHIQTWSVIHPSDTILEFALKGVEDVKPVLQKIERLASIPDGQE